MSVYVIINVGENNYEQRFRVSPNQPYNPYAASQSAASSNALIQRVSYLLCTALLVTAGAGVLGGRAASAQLSPAALFLPLMLGTFGCVFRPVVCPEQSRPEPAVLLYAPQRSGRTADGGRCLA